MNARNEQQGFTAADMADQGARQFEAGYAAAKAELHAAAQEAVYWQRKYTGATRGGRAAEWHTVTKDEFEATKAGKWADRYEVRALYAAPAPAAPGIDLEQFRNAVNYWFAKCSLTFGPSAVERIRNEANRLLRLIDASPKGGSTDSEPKIWGTQKPGSMPKLFGAHYIAELNWYPDEGYDLVCMQVIERVQAASAEVGE